ncbi:hypothetical protein PPYR_06869 [Photinus pyralis]|uniref:DUF4794 domain-containing protein n=1 Tax=Photinus pyralis TaxID=7054 RepID=A0A5N4ANT7_PHOPY|nr:uncharacterized protein LOC116169761 [Photinus pyralis]KAB0798989.1 hypothetical protein PPYR_06869 [Photinus pyralis]
MKSYLVLVSFIVTILAEDKPDAVAQERSDSDKQEYETYYKFSPQRSAQQIPEQLLNFHQQAANYVPQVNFIPQQQKYAAAPVPAHIMYGFAPQVQQQLEYASQPGAATFAQSAHKPQPAAAARQLPAPQINFSPASEVSSFRFSSPLVTYSNQGVLQQLTGKLAAGGDASPVGQESQTVAPKKIAKTSQPVAYAQSPQFAHAQESASQEYNYANLPQQQIAYVTVPQRVAYAPQQPQAKAAYAAAPKQYYAIAAPQQAAYPSHAYSPSDLQQFAYVLAVPQGGRSAAQPIYVTQQQGKYQGQGENYQK